jgi:hypothetical protein
MANELTKITLSRNSVDTAPQAVQEVDTDTAAYIDVSGIDASKLILHVNYTGASTGAVYKIKDGAQYTGGTVGDLTLTDIGKDTFYVGPLETHRFKDSDGRINIEATTDGDTAFMSFRAILLP